MSGSSITGELPFRYRVKLNATISSGVFGILVKGTFQYLTVTQLKNLGYPQDVIDEASRLEQEWLDEKKKKQTQEKQPLESQETQDVGGQKEEAGSESGYGGEDLSGVDPGGTVEKSTEDVIEPPPTTTKKKTTRRKKST